MFPTVPIIYFLVCGVIGLILWLKMLGILEDKGQKVNSLFVTPRQYIDFFRVIKTESNPTMRKRYRIILWTQFTLIPIFIIGGIILISLTV